jgi:putative beta-lysine N-acetyltransferase
MENSKFDKVEKLDCGSFIQHGSCNDRVYLMKTGVEASELLPDTLISIAEERGYSKIFAKIHSKSKENFINAGFVEEAVVPNFFSGKDTGIFMGCYITAERSNEPAYKLYEDNLSLALAKKNNKISALDTERFLLRPCKEEDVERMAEIYTVVFPSYPFPIHESEYLLETMRSYVDYFCIEAEGKIVALSSAEMDLKNSNVEMTDFATLPDWRGNGFGIHLLKRMERNVKEKGVKTAYTIARAASAGMNITFAKSGYIFAGRLINNTNISGTIESMNVWYKSLI